MFVWSNERPGKCTGREIWICSWDPFPCCIVSRIELIDLTYYKQAFKEQKKKALRFKIYLQKVTNCFNVHGIIFEQVVLVSSATFFFLGALLNNSLKC